MKVLTSLFTLLMIISWSSNAASPRRDRLVEKRQHLNEYTISGSPYFGSKQFLEFTPKGNPNYICIFGNGVGLACFPKQR